MPETAHLDVLTEEVCRFLLTTEEVGRVAFLDADDYPVVLPVNYVVDGDFVVFRTDQGTKLREMPLRRVAFEVDHLAPANRSGWSVLVQGHGEEVTNAIDPTHAQLRDGNVEPWAPGDKQRWVAVQIHRITGRRLVRSIRTCRCCSRRRSRLASRRRWPTASSRWCCSEDSQRSRSCSRVLASIA